jgi:hypothetical protein
MENSCFRTFWVCSLFTGLAVIVGGLGYSIYASVLNPGLGEARFFVKCWWAYALIIVGSLVAMASLCGKSIDTKDHKDVA